MTPYRKKLIVHEAFQMTEERRALAVGLNDLLGFLLAT